MIKIAIIGAGISGLTVANQLKKYADITIFEKARGPGGRISTRRVSPSYSFDHGAQFFKANSQEFRIFVDILLKEGVIKQWCGHFAEIKKQGTLSQRTWDESNAHYVGVPSMSSISRYLSEGMNICLNKLVKPIKQNDMWQIIDDQGEKLGNFDWVIITAPAAQSLNLIPKFLKEEYEYISSIKMASCYSLMLGFDKPLKLNFDAALVKEADISWISVNSSKPVRLGNFCLLVNSTNCWAESNIDKDKQQVMEYLLNHTSNIIGHDMNTANYKDLHLWRYANIKKQKGKQYLINLKEKLGVCGDWFIQGRVESAYTSAFKLSRKLIKNITE